MSAQSQRQLAERNVRTTAVRTVDERKGERTVRVVSTTYDRRGNITEVVERDESGRIMKWEKHAFDRKGHEVLVALVDSVGVEIQRTENTWDRWGNQTGSTTSEGGHISERTATTYDKYGDKQQELVTDGEGRQVRRTTYAYEGKGLIIRRTVYDAKDHVVYDRSYTYTY